MSKDLKLISGTSNLALSQRISEYMGKPLSRRSIKRFSDGEIWVRFDENIRGTDVFIIQSTNPPGDNMVELLLLIDTARRASAERITAVIPYYGYSRQDRKDQPRVPISAKLFMNVITSAGANRVLTMDLHSTQIQGFVDIPFDHLYAKGVFLDHIKKNLDLRNTVVVSPDVGGIKIARSYAQHLGLDLAIFDKRRPRPNRAEVMNLIGNIKGKDIVFIDDMIDTGGTITAAAEVAREKGAGKILTYATHGILSGGAIEKIRNSPIDKLYISDTLPLPEEKHLDKIEVKSVASIFGEAIMRTHNEESISSLFEYNKTVNKT